MKYYCSCLILILMLCHSCKEAELPYRPFYKLVTNESWVDRNGVKFIATIEEMGEDAITERGFVVERHYYDAYPWLKPVTEKYSIPLDGPFELLLENDWDAGITSNAYAYMKTQNYNYRGEMVYFTPKGSRPPVVHSVTPANGGRYGTMVIKGENFSKTASRIKVYLNDEQCYLESASPTELVVSYYLNRIGDYDLVVNVNGEIATVNKAYHLDGPKILSVSPAEVYTGQELTLELENFDANTEVSVVIGGKSAYIMEKSNNRIRCVCPMIPNGGTTIVYLYLPKEGVSTADFVRPASKLWTSLGIQTSAPGTPYFIHENEGYGLYDNGLRIYDKSRNNWQDLTSIPEKIYATAIFAKGDYIYVAGQARDSEGKYLMVKYHIPTHIWTESPNPLPAPLSNSNHGEWKNGEYYISSTYGWSGLRLMKYNLLTDAWVLLNDQMDGLYKFFVVNDKVYALLGKSIYEYNLEQQVRGKRVYEFPAYMEVYPYTMLRKDNQVYFSSGHYDPLYLFCFDLERLELKPLGLPDGYYAGFDFILPFREGLWVATTYVDRGVHKYIGAY